MSVDQQEKASFLKRPVGGKAAKDTAPKTGKFNIPPRPQVNLMPPEILESRHLAVVKRKLVAAVIAILVICALAFAVGYLVRGSAESRYNDAMAQADTLTAQKRQFSPVIQVQKDILNTTNARAFALNNEVDWSSYVYAIQGVLPEGVTIDSLQVDGIGPGDPLSAGADDLTRPGLAVISFSATSLTLPDVSEWIEALQSVAGLADANIQSSTLQSTTGEISYQVAATVQVTEEARANRTFDDPATSGDATDSED